MAFAGCMHGGHLCGAAASLAMAEVCFALSIVGLFPARILFGLNA